MTREEVKKKIYEKKVKKALRSYRFRPFKNFVFWFAGVLTSVAVVAGAVFVGVKVVPIKTYTGGMEEGYVSEEIASKSILDVILNYNKYGISDIPGVRDMLVDSIAGSIAGNYITIDKDKLNAVTFNLDKDGGKEMIEALLNSITINPEGLSSVNEGVATLSVFNEYQEAENPQEMFNGEDYYISDTETNNPKLYYYEVVETRTGGGAQGLSTEPPAQSKKYARAYDDNGKRLAPNGAKLYYPALKDVPILDITQMIDKFVERIDIGEVISVVLPEDSASSGILGTVVEALAGQNLSNIEDFANNFLTKLRLCDIIGENGVEGLESLFQLDVFNWCEVPKTEFGGKVDVSGNILKDDSEPANFLLNPALYYYKDKNDEYLCAFDTETGCIKVDQNEQLYYANIFEIPLSEVLVVINESLNRVELTELLTALNIQLDDDSLVDVVLDGATIKDLADQNYINTVLNKLTLDSLGADLGVLTKLKIFGEWEIVAEDDMPIKNSENKISNGTNPKLYYYVANNSDVGEGGKLNDTAYARAFDDEGVVVNELITSNTTLYYAKLSALGFADMSELIQYRFGGIKVVDLLESFGGASIDDGDLFSLVLGDKTVSQLGDITNADIYLHWVMPYSATTKTTYELILNAMGKEFNEENIKELAELVTTADLANTQLNFDNIGLSQFIDSSTLTLICDAINAYRNSNEYTGTNKNITVSTASVSVGDMLDFNTNYISLSAVAGGMNDSVKTLICQLVNKTNFATITVKDLSNIDPDRILLGRFITDQNTLNMICKAITSYRASVSNNNAVYPATVTVGDIKDFKPDYILLGGVASGMSENMKTLICQLVNNPNFDNIMVKDLSSINSFNGVKLCTVLPYYKQGSADNRALYKILIEATTNVNVSLLDETQIKAEAEGLGISALGNFKISNLRLATAMPEVNSQLKKMIQQITKNSDFDSIKISDLSGTLYLDNLDLSVVLGTYENSKALYDILLEASNQDKTKENAESLKASALTDFDLTKVSLSTAITAPTGNTIIDTLRLDSSVNLGNIGTKINGLKLYDVFGKNCFTTNENEKVAGTHQFKLENGAYVHLSAAEAENYDGDIYYIHQNDGIWLLICFEFGEINQTGDDIGRPNEYRISNKTLGNLIDTKDDDFMTVALTKATLRQLMDAGMISPVKEKLYNYTLETLIKAIDSMPDSVLDTLLK